MSPASCVTASPWRPGKYSGVCIVAWIAYLCWVVHVWPIGQVILKPGERSSLVGLALQRSIPISPSLDGQVLICNCIKRARGYHLHYFQNSLFVNALQVPEAHGRYITSHSSTISTKTLSEILSKRFPQFKFPQGEDTPAKEVIDNSKVSTHQSLV